MNAFIRFLYSIIVAVAVAVFVGVAIVTFYTPPQGPDYNSYYSSSVSSQEQVNNNQTAYSKASSAYRSKEKIYQQHVTYVLLPVATAIFCAGLYFIKRVEVIGEGLALGGILLFIYSILTASIADVKDARFLAVTLFLVSSLLLAQRRFLATSK